MRASLPIGDFSRATHLSVKTLRHYHRVGLLEPADVDQDSGHRRYTTDQIPTAQVIRRSGRWKCRSTTSGQFSRPRTWLSGMISSPRI